MIRKGLPRPFELVLAGLALLFLLPLLALVWCVIALSSAGSPLLRQPRVGLGGRVFRMYKFRTMRGDGAAPFVTVGNDPRITPLGRFLRHSKIDELPQLLNVLTGDMSLVGPRPHVPQYVDLSWPQWRFTLSVRPGITDPVTQSLRHEERLLETIQGDADAYYRTHLLPRKLEGYSRYLQTRSAFGDLRILALTVWCVLVPSLTPLDDTSLPPLSR